MSLSGKATIKNILGGMATTIDDNATAAAIVILYHGGPETLRWLFNIEDMDVVVTVADPNVVSSRDLQDVPEHYAEVHPVTVTTIDKRPGVTATKMQRKMRVQMRAVIEAAAQGTNYTVKILRESSMNRRRGGILQLIWETIYSVEYKDA